MLRLREIIIDTIAPNIPNVLWIDTSGNNVVSKVCRNGQWEPVYSYSDEEATEEAMQKSIVNNAASVSDLRVGLSGLQSDYEEQEVEIEGIKEEQATHDAQIINLQTGKENVETVVTDGTTSITLMDDHAYIFDAAFIMTLDINLHDSFTTNSKARVVFNSGSTATTINTTSDIKGLENMPTNAKVEIIIKGDLATVYTWDL